MEADMKPSKEQVEQWAREAAIQPVEAVDFRREMGQEMTDPERDAWDAALRFAAIAYAAGQADERARCCKLIHGHSNNDNLAQRIVDAIRARSKA